MNFCYIYLTCDAKEADELAQTLLNRHLVVCVKKTVVDAQYWWQKDLEKATETLLIMESAEEKFGDIEALLGKIHSYDTFVLTAVPMVKVSKDAKQWFNKYLEEKI